MSIYHNEDSKKNLVKSFRSLPGRARLLLGGGLSLSLSPVDGIWSVCVALWTEANRGQSILQYMKYIRPENRVNCSPNEKKRRNDFYFIFWCREEPNDDRDFLVVLDLNAYAIKLPSLLSVFCFTLFVFAMLSLFHVLPFHFNSSLIRKRAWFGLVTITSNQCCQENTFGYIGPNTQLMRFLVNPLKLHLTKYSSILRKLHEKFAVN